MPFTRPTLTELIDRVWTDISSRIPGGTNSTFLRRSLAGILARAEAGAVHSLYGYLDFIARQVFPDTAEAEYLDRWAVIWLTGGRKPATFAGGALTLQVTGPAGVPLPAGTEYRRADGAVFETTEELVLSGPTGLVGLKAQAAGAAGNTPAGNVLSLLQPVAGFTSSATVVSPGVQGGVDQETDQALQARIIRRIQFPPQGGSADDYVTWALEVPGVTRAWVYPGQMGLGTVTVLVGNDDASAGFIPDPAVVAAAQAYIDQRRPVTAEVFVLAPTSVAVPVTAAISPDNSSTRAAAEAELQDLFLRDAAPGGTIYISKIREAVSIAAGVSNSRIDSPTADFVATTGQLPRLGAITWVPI